MPTKLEFVPCPHCGKSVRSNARECHRCHGSLLGDGRRSSLKGSNPADHLASESNSLETEHSAVAHGGYDDYQDDFNYDEYIEEEFNGKTKRSWKTCMVWLLILALVLPMLVSILSLL